jgi:hypothetical protein
VYVPYMAGNFRGMLIFVIFVVNLQSQKFPPLKINVYRYVSIERGMAKNIVEARPPFLCVSWQAIIATVIQLMASLMLIFFHLMLFA